MRAVSNLFLGLLALAAAPVSAASIANISATAGTLTFSTLAAGDDLTNNSTFSNSTLGAFVFDEGNVGSLQSFLLHFDRNGGANTTVAGTFDILLDTGETYLGEATSRNALLASDPLNGVVYQTAPGTATTYRGLESDDNLLAVLDGSTVHISYRFVNGTSNALDEARLRIGTSAVPEPANWLLMLAGFAATGAVLRHNRRALPSLKSA